MRGGNGNGGDQGRKCSPAKIRSCLRTFFAHLFSHLGLCVLIVGYTILGALMFERLEHAHEAKLFADRTSKFRQLRLHYVTELWNITEQFNVLYELNWTSAVEKELRKFEATVISTAKKDGILEGAAAAGKGEELHWTFSGALLYSVSIITTIGYGNTAPRTQLGKILTILYAVIGVPLMLLWLSNIGTLMANTFKFAYVHACCVKRQPSNQHRRMSRRKEPSPLQVNYSLEERKCETQVVAKKSPPRPLRALDPAAKQVLLECAQYNADSMGDPTSVRILRQLSAPDHELEIESSDEVESVIEVKGQGHGFPPLCSVVGVNEGTPSKVPLLVQGGQGGGYGPDLVSSPCPDQPSPAPFSEQRVPVSLVLTFVVLYILGGAGIFSYWEEWGFLESAYFCFITLSTIGLGDYVPGASLGSAGTREGQAQLIVCCLYLVLGLAIIAMSFNLVQEEVAAKVKDIARHVGIIKDEDESR